MKVVRSLTQAAGVVAAVLGLVGGVPQAHAAPQPPSTANAADVRFIVKRDASVSDARFERSARRAGFVVLRSQSALGLAVVEGPAGGRSALRAVSGAVSVADDYEVRPQSLGFEYSTQVGSMVNVTRSTGAQNMWKAGYTGAGVDVAVLDTGVSPVASLSASDKVVIGPDLSFESQAANARHLDSYGHGTAMSGIIAGRETARASGTTYAADTKNYYGMAPDARIISIKMADRSGAVDVSQMIAGIDWVVTNRTKVGNIRVLNISYGAKSSLNAQNDPLSWAAESAWRNGIAVVASTGNDGQSSVGLASPAYNPWVISVGAGDTKNTATSADDTVAPFSNIGNSTSKRPDILAPGIGIISPSAPGSQIATSHPGARIGNGFIRGSGTSQAAAVVSGAAALVLQKYPSLKPDELKRFLGRSAYELSSAPTVMAGKGMVNLNRVLSDPPPYGFRDTYTVGNGKGSIEAARGGNYVTVNGTALKGEVDIMGRAWNSATMATSAANGTAWDANGNFNGAAWTGTGLTTDTASWAGRTWQGRTWQGRTWQGGNWAGRTWATGSWSSSGWTSATWTGPVGKPSWAGAVWASSSWG